MTSALLLSLLLTAEVPPDDPALLQGLDAAGVRMLVPSRERILKADALVDGLGLKGTEHVADVGSGPGFFTLKLARRVPQGKVVAIDVDEAALTVLQRRAHAAALANIETRHAAPDEAGLAKGAFDLIFLCQVDHYLKDRTAYFRQFAPALKKGGRLVIANYEKYRQAVEEAAAAAGFVPLRSVIEAPGHFAVIFVRKGEP
jgi:SAM-dependent methyltransferase